MGSDARHDHGDLLAELTEAYRMHAPVSAQLNKRAEAVLVDGGSHALRLVEPFPPRVVSAEGAWVRDEDGHSILDFWQGHCANVLGHNPEIVTAELARGFAGRQGLQVGLTDRLQVEVAELICGSTGTERVRFTTSGTLATMYAVMLARAFTGRELVVKIGGGWHGGQPWGLKGVSYQAQGGGFEHADSAGVPQDIMDDVLVTRYNDPGLLTDQFRRSGDGIAALIVEPFLGGGGFIASTVEYLRAARELTERYGAVLILDEVISGYHFGAGDLGAIYGVRPDLMTLGKMVGGGMPVAAVAGRADILGLAGRAAGAGVGSAAVRFSGGTYSAHPSSLLAAKIALGHLIEHAAEIYPRIFSLGQSLRRCVESAFADEGIYAWCSGMGADPLPGSPFFRVHFPRVAGRKLVCPEQVLDPCVCDVALSTHVLSLALLLENVHVVHGHGMVTTAHSEENLARFETACRQVARWIRVRRPI